MEASWSLSLFLLFFFFEKKMYVQVVVIVAHIFPWFYVQERLKRPLCKYGSMDFLDPSHEKKVKVELYLA